MVNFLTVSELVPYLTIAFIIVTRFAFKNSPKLLWPSILISIITCCFYSKIFLLGAFFLLIISGLIIGLNKTGKSWLLFISASFLSIVIYLHFIPGFNNFLYFDQIIVSKDGWPFNLYMNFNKAIVALILSMAFGAIISDTPVIKKGVMKTVLLGLIIVMTTALAVGFIRFDIKFPNIFWLWAFNNLVFVCFAEEVLFRGFIQRNLENYTGSPKLAIIIASVLFGAYHYMGGLTYVGLSTLAGLFYGYAYHQTKRIETSILFHFILNTIHILFFTYPALKY